MKQNRLTTLRRQTLMTQTEGTKTFAVLLNLFESFDEFYFEGFLMSCGKAHHLPTEEDNDFIVGTMSSFIEELLMHDLEDSPVDAEELAASYYTLFLMIMGAELKAIA